MRPTTTMEQGKDIVGGGIVGTIVAFSTPINDVVSMALTAATVSSASVLGGYIMRKLIATLENWWKNRKSKTKKEIE